MVLFINGNYPFHSLHSELVLRLAEIGHKICVYVPLNRKNFRENKDKYIVEHRNVTIIYSDILTFNDRVFFYHKEKKLVKDIEEKIDINSVNCIISGTLYSDGVVSYLLSEKYSIPFSATVRQTDVTIHMTWRPYLNTYMKKLISKAFKIIYLSPAYKKYVKKYCENEDKYLIIPNGINDYWFSDSQSRPLNKELITLISVCEICKNKNITSSLNVVKKLVSDGLNIRYFIVGSGDQEESCRRLSEDLSINERVIFCGWQNKKAKLKYYYDQADIFIMPSYRESFGTVYIEAMSQGIPLIYTKNQGIDGYFEQGKVGYACNPDDYYEQAESVKSIVDDYEAISENCVNESKNFQWDVIAEQYNQLINEMKDHR